MIGSQPVPFIPECHQLLGHFGILILVLGTLLDLLLVRFGELLELVFQGAE